MERATARSSLNSPVAHRSGGADENALAGQMPGADIQIRVRGTGSINASNEPLYVANEGYL